MATTGLPDLGTPITVPPADAVEIPGAPGPATTPATPDTAPGKRPTTRAGRAAAAAAKRAERQASRAKAKDAAPERPKVTGRDVASSVAQLHTFAGGALPFVGLPATGAALEASAKDAGEAWAAVVKRYPQLEKLFGTGTDGLVLLRLLMVYAPIVSLALSERTAPKGEGDPMAGLAGLAGLGNLMGQAQAATTDLHAAMREAAPGPYAQDVPPGQNTGGRP